MISIRRRRRPAARRWTTLCLWTSAAGGGLWRRRVQQPVGLLHRARFGCACLGGSLLSWLWLGAVRRHARLDAFALHGAGAGVVVLRRAARLALAAAGRFGCCRGRPNGRGSR